MGLNDRTAGEKRADMPFDVNKTVKYINSLYQRVTRDRVKEE